LNDLETREFVDGNKNNQENISTNENSLTDEDSTGNLTMSKDAPFTSHLSIFSSFDLSLMKSFRNPVIFCSATSQIHQLEKVKEATQNDSIFLKSSHIRQQLDELVIVHTPNDYFYSNKIVWKNLWEKFGKYFYEKLTKVDQNVLLVDQNASLVDQNVVDQNVVDQKVLLKEPVYALCFLPSETKTEYFFNQCLFSDNVYFAHIMNRNEKQSCEPKFMVEGAHVIKTSIRVASSQSTISVGLSMPNHKFIMLATNIFKPFSYLKAFNEMELKDCQYEIAFKVLQQAVGRHARLTKLERENRNLKSKRVVFLNKTKN
jgi:hypothetical protein